MRAHAKRTGLPKKIGLYTSPHLLHPEERIRLNFQPLPRELLARYFFEVYDKLPQLATLPDSSKPPVERGPRFLQLWALFAFHVFIREGADAVIMETHNGGENDATNVVTKPLVTAITTLGLDHIEILGNSIESIAWHKAGIYKEGAVALSTRQESSPTAVLEQRAQKVGQKVIFIDEDPRLPSNSRHLEPSVQRKNASLAAAAAEAFLKQTTGAGEHELTIDDLRTGVEQWSWPGRYEILQQGPETWFLDAAHCTLSVALAAQWFASESAARCTNGGDPTRVLIFSHMNKLRDARSLLESLVTALKECNAGVQHVIFSTYDEISEESSGVAEVFDAFAENWQHHLPDTRIWKEPTVQGAIQRARQLHTENDDLHVLVTGSQYLLGSALRQLHKKTDAESPN